MFARGDVPAASILMKALRIFGNCCIYMGGMDDDEKLALLSCISFTEGCMYLGIPLTTERLRSTDYSYMLVDALIQKVNVWPHKTLSYAGKLEVIRWVRQGVECFLAFYRAHLLRHYR